MKLNEVKFNKFDFKLNLKFYDRELNVRIIALPGIIMIIADHRVIN